MVKLWRIQDLYWYQYWFISDFYLEIFRSVMNVRRPSNDILLSLLEKTSWICYKQSSEAHCGFIWLLSILKWVVGPAKLKSVISNIIDCKNISSASYYYCLKVILSFSNHCYKKFIDMFLYYFYIFPDSNTGRKILGFLKWKLA